MAMVDVDSGYAAKVVWLGLGSAAAWLEPGELLHIINVGMCIIITPRH